MRYEDFLKNYQYDLYVSSEGKKLLVTRIYKEYSIYDNRFRKTYATGFDEMGSVRYKKTNLF